MASDKFGNNPVAPLYNATGRNPRDVEMGTPGKPLGSVGSSGAGGKDFGISNQASKKTDMLSTSNFYSPFNPYNVLMNRMSPGGGRRGRRGRGFGGGGDEEEVEYDIDAMERIAKAATPTTVQFGDANTGTINDYSVNKRAVNSKVAVGNDMNIANRQEQNLTSSAESGSAPAKPPRVKTQAQKDRANEQARARRALQSDIEKSGTAEQKERIAKEGLTGRKNSGSKPVAKPVPVRNRPTGNIRMTQAIGGLKQTASAGGNL